MKATEFTDEIGRAIARQFQNFNASYAHHVVKTGQKWVGENAGCYAYLSDYLLDRPGHPDHFGIGYKPWSAQGKAGKYGKDCISWLYHLMNPDGPFKEVLPYLWKKTPREVLADKGFVLINQEDPACNTKLVWTFLLAARMLFEHSIKRRRFTEAKKLTKDKTIIVLTTLALQPRNVTKPTGDDHWVPAIADHGSPMSLNPMWKAKSFLLGRTQMVKDSSPFQSASCFPEDKGPDGSKPLPEWIKEMEIIREAAA